MGMIICRVGYARGMSHEGHLGAITGIWAGHGQSACNLCMVCVTGWAQMGHGLCHMLDMKVSTLGTYVT